MSFIFKSELIEYDFINNKKPQTILFLHGWGGNKYSFNSTINLLKPNYNILTLTIPTLDPTITVWDIHDYTQLVSNLLAINNIINPIVICHSFGFRIATLLARKIRFEKLIITGGAGPKKNKKFSKITKNNAILLLKSSKFSYLYKKTASKDYIKLHNINKLTFKNIVNFNSINLIKFSCPIFAFWGKQDKETPLWILHLIKKFNKLKYTVVNGGHFSYATHNELFNHEIIRFLK